MKINRILLLLTFLVCFSSTFSQSKLIANRNIENTASKAQAIIKKNNAYVSVDFVDINIDKLTDNEQFVLEFGGKSIIVQKQKLDIRGKNSFVFVGKNQENGNSILFSVIDGDIQGIIETLESVYSIETIGEKEYAIIKIDQSQFIEGCNHLIENPNEITTENYSAPVRHISANTNSLLASSGPYNCKIRVLVLYTPAAQSTVSNVKNTILLATELTNQSFANSNINHQIELVYAGLTNYPEVPSIETNNNRFRDNNDGYMDEVHTLRNQYSADVCLLLVSNNVDACGIAYGINVSATNAFCTVNIDCATDYYSFGHEIGHLVGCRHDTYVDPSTTPYAYGHGYVYSPDHWRTIMAYVNACSSCTRIQYWSNPNVTFNGAAMGTASTSNNARVWNERSNTVMTFRQPVNNVTVTNSFVSNCRYGDIVAKNTIETSGTVNVVYGTTLNMRAGNEILLQPGFTVELGAEFSANPQNVTDCPN
jgi:hypothetical protein